MSTSLFLDMQCVEHASTTGDAKMTGFSQSAIWEKKDGVNEMTMWPPEKVPIITTLAKQFANFDHFFCSHPGKRRR
jgi:phospholipase C